MGSTASIASHQSSAQTSIAHIGSPVGSSGSPASCGSGSPASSAGSHSSTGGGSLSLLDKTPPDGWVDPGVHVDSIDEFHSNLPLEITNVQEGGGFSSVGSLAMDIATVGLTRLASMDITFHHWLVLEIENGRRYCSIAFFGNNKREILFDSTPEKLHARSHKVVKTSMQDNRKAWHWWGPPAHRLVINDVYRFMEAYIRDYGKYFWGSGNDPIANSCQSFCRNFEARYHRAAPLGKK